MAAKHLNEPIELILRNMRAKTPDGDSHLMDAFRLTCQCGLFVAEKMG
jgi:hypothetical protein